MMKNKKLYLLILLTCLVLLALTPPPPNLPAPGSTFILETEDDFFTAELIFGHNNTIEVNTLILKDTETPWGEVINAGRIGGLSLSYTLRGNTLIVTNLLSDFLYREFQLSADGHSLTSINGFSEEVYRRTAPTVIPSSLPPLPNPNPFANAAFTHVDDSTAIIVFNEDNILESRWLHYGSGVIETAESSAYTISGNTLTQVTIVTGTPVSFPPHYLSFRIGDNNNTLTFITNDGTLDEVYIRNR
ncbi:MAG: hypothetical protein FWE37_06190 [Spirochaetaceae bacterium]|nr:hypothetical protein [Spirochaetaceae bacterium]